MMPLRFWPLLAVLVDVKGGQPRWANSKQALVRRDESLLHLDTDDIPSRINNQHRSADDEVAVVRDTARINNQHRNADDEVAVVGFSSAGDMARIDNKHRSADDEVAVVGFSFDGDIRTSYIEPPRSTAKISQQDASAATLSNGAKRLHIISVLGSSDIDRALEVQAAIKKRLGPSDALSHLSGPSCFQKAAGRLSDLDAMPDVSFPGGECRTASGSCNAYMIAAALKFPYAMVHLVQKQYSQKRDMAEWFMLKDYDTYVDAERLMAAVKDYDPTKPYAFGSLQPGCPGVCGSAGVLFSGALAEELAIKNGEKWKQWGMDQLLHGTFYWDVQIPTVVHWIDGSQLINLPKMQPFGPFDRECTYGTGGSWNLNPSQCHKVAECKCALDDEPATYHVKINLKQACDLFLK